MALIIDPTSFTETALRERLTLLRDELSKLSAMLAKAPPTLPNPWALETLKSQLESSITLADGVLGLGDASKKLLAEVANELYESGNVAP